MLEDVTHERFYGPEVGRFFQDTLTEHGVKVHGGQELERFEGRATACERWSRSPDSRSTATSS